ncbi:MAG: ABC transporter substrate-binding protein [Lachnospiraceae bacterium]|nr:ABC transporter substrate-binding protein [Lachnospiraceae bacterium]
MSNNSVARRQMTLIAALLLLLTSILTGCSASSAVPSQESDTVIGASADTDLEAACTFTDALDRSVTVHAPRRTAALLGSFAQIWQLAGGEVCATADDAWDDLALDLAPDTVNLGKTKELSLEKLLEARPDFILASTNTRQNVEWKDTLEAAGIPVAYFDVSDFEDYLQLLKICTSITGRSDLYEKNGLNVQTQIEAVLQKSQERIAVSDSPKVLSLAASASKVRAKNSTSNVLGRMLYALGCENIADSDQTLLENLSLEHILQADPDFIFVVQHGDDTEGTRRLFEQMMDEQPAWKQLSAVRSGRIYFMEKSLYSLKPNHRWGEAYELLEEILTDE